MKLDKVVSIVNGKDRKAYQYIESESQGNGIKSRIFNLISKTTIRESTVALIDQGVVSVANFLTGLIIGRICAKEEFGLYTLGFTIVVLIINFQGFLISTPYTIYSPRMKNSELAGYTGSTLVHQLVLSLLIIFILIVTAGILSLGFGPPGLISIIKTLIFVISFILLWDYARRICFAVLRMNTALVIDCCVAVIQVGGLSLLAYSGLLAASYAYWVIGAACAVAALGWLISTWKGFNVRFSRIIPDLQKNLSTGLWMSASGLLWTLSVYLYPWFLAAFHGTASTGVWAACFGIVSICNPLFIGLSNSFSPKMAHAYARGEADVLRRFSLQITMAFGVIITPFCIAFFIFGGHLVTGLYGSKYAGNGLVVSILALNLLVTALSFPPVRALFTIERADLDFKINLLLMLGLFSYGILLAKYFGPTGAAAGLLISNSGCLILRYILFSRLVRTNPTRAHR